MIRTQGQQPGQAAEENHGYQTHYRCACDGGALCRDKSEIDQQPGPGSDNTAHQVGSHERTPDARLFWLQLAGKCRTVGCRSVGCPNQIHLGIVQTDRFTCCRAVSASSWLMKSPAALGNERSPNITRLIFMVALFASTNLPLQAIRHRQLRTYLGRGFRSMARTGVN